MRHQPRFHGIEVNVARQVQQIVIAIDGQGLKPPLKQTAAAIVAAVDGVGVGQGEASHGGVEVGGSQVNQKVVVIGHEAVSDDVNRGGGDVMAKLLQKEQIVGPLKEDNLPIVAAIVEVVVVAGAHGSRASGHGGAT